MNELISMIMWQKMITNHVIMMNTCTLQASIVRSHHNYEKQTAFYFKKCHMCHSTLLVELRLEHKLKLLGIRSAS